MEKDTRVQVPVYWGELGEDCQADFLDQLSEKIGVSQDELRATMVQMDKEGKFVGHIVVYEYDIKSSLGVERWE